MNLHQTIKLTNDCIVFVCEFIEFESCLFGPRRYPEQFVSMYRHVLSHVIV